MKENIQTIYPLTPLQNGMLFHAVVDEQQHAYFQQVRCKFEGTVNEFLIRESWLELINRHEVLRSVFIWKHERDPLHVVLREMDMPMTFLDWSNNQTPVEKNELERLLVKDRKKPFNISKPPLMRLLVVQIKTNEFELIWSHHHILLDGWSTGLLFSEFQKIYHAKSIDEPLNLPKPFQYKNYVSWLKRQNENEAKQFWSNYLKGIDTTTSIPNDRGVLGEESLEYLLDISEELSQKLITFAAKEKVTTNVLFLSIWALLVSRYQTEEEVLVGVTVSGRSEEIPNIENGMGLFINSLPFRIQTTSNKKVGAWLKEVQKNLLSLRDYEYSSLSKIKEWSDFSALSPLFESLFVYENYPVSNSVTHEFGNIKLQSTEIFERTNYPLTTIVEPQGDYIALRFLYSPTRIDSEDIKQIAKNYVNLLENIVEEGNISESEVSQVSLLTQEKSITLINGWNDTKTPYNEEICLHQLFENQCNKTPNNLAIIDQKGSLQYRELNDSANKIANSLLDFGIEKEEYVAVFFNRDKEMISALFGILKSGGIYVPIDVSNPTSRVQYILESLDIRFAVSQEKNTEGLIATKCLTRNQIICLDENGQIDAKRKNISVKYSNKTENPELSISTNKYAYVIFTSGSTGTPKGVTVTHKPVINLIEWITKEFSMCEKDQVLLVSSLCFDLSVYDIFGLLAVGGSIRVASDEDIREPNLLLKYILNEPITFWDSAPAALQQLVPFFPSEKVESKLRLVFQSGDWIPLSLPNKMKSIFSNLSFISLGGATEATVWSNFYPVKEMNPRWKSIPYGRPIQNARYYILDHQFNVCPPGVPGDLYIGGECLSSLYANEPELTAKKFVTDIFSKKEDGRMYFTGDRASFYPDGNIEFLGRVDDQVKVRGYRIELKEIQACLSKHEAINTSIVIVKNDKAGYKQIVAYYTLERNQKTDEKTLKDYLENILPSYMIPSNIVVLDRIPITVNGKLDRKALPNPQAKAESITSEDKPLNAIEELIWNNWTSLLGTQPASRDANFFDAGGHSLLATQLIARLRVALSVDISVRSIFENPTPALLRSYIDTIKNVEKVAKISWEKAGKSEYKQLSFAQERLLFLYLLKPESSFYNVPLTIKLTGELNKEALEKSIYQIVQRHEVLRSTYHLIDEKEVQKIHNDYQIPWLEFDYSEYEDAEFEVMKTLKSEGQKAFDLTKAPLVKAILVKTSKEEYFFQLNTHHIAIDGWSIGILVKELASFYNHNTQSKEYKTYELEYQYSDYANWQRTYLNENVLKNQLGYWKKQLHNFSNLQLPTKQDTENQTEKNKVFRATITKEQSNALRKLSQENNCTLFMTLLTAFNIQLHAISKQEDIVIGTDVANRSHINTEKLVGFFVNQIVLRNNLSNNPTAKSLLKKVRTNTLSAYQYQDLPFEKLVQFLNPKRATNQMPFFNVKIVLQNNDIEDLEMNDIAISTIDMASNDSKYDILMSFDDRETLMVSIEYKSHLYTESTIEKWWQDLLLVLEKMTESLSHRLSNFVEAIHQKTTINKDQEKRRLGLQKLRKLRVN